MQTWRGSNEVWETVYVEEGAGFELGPQRWPHQGVFCVWELGAIVHEKDAWIRFLRSARDETAAETYLSDTFAGVV